MFLLILQDAPTDAQDDLQYAGAVFLQIFKKSLTHCKRYFLNYLE